MRKVLIGILFLALALEVYTYANLDSARVAVESWRIHAAELDAARAALTRENDILKQENIKAGILEPVSILALKAFLAQDTGNLRPYDDIKYNCVDFSVALVTAARAAGIQANVLLIDFTSGIGHAIVVFTTTDSGTVYDEPQNDGFYVEPKPGYELCSLDGSYCTSLEVTRAVLVP